MITATLSQSALKILISGDTYPHRDFLGTLPEAKWHANQNAWACDFTPAAAWSLCAYGRKNGGIETDENILSASVDFATGLLTGRSFEQLQSPKHLVHKPWLHQAKAIHFATAFDSVLLDLAMGTGKTCVAISQILDRRCQTVLIVCPASVCGVWAREFARHSAEPVEVKVLNTGSVANKTARAILHLKLCQVQHLPAVFVINYESAWRPGFDKWALGIQWDCVVSDESHRIGNPTTKISRFMASLGKVAKFRLCLSGTPLGQGPLQAFGQFLFLDRGIFGTSWHRFRHHYAHFNKMFPSKIERYLNQEEFAAKLALITYRVTEAEANQNLPEVLHHERRFDLSDKGRRVYDELEEELIADLESGVVTATNSLVRLLRLQQLTSGFVEEDETKVIHEVDDGKSLALGEIIDDLPMAEPLVVFCKFRRDLDTVQRMAEKLGRRYAELSGRRKDGLTEHATMSEGVQVLGVQWQSGGVGIDLTRASYCVLFSTGFSAVDFEQGLKRVSRPGQSKTTHFYRLIANRSVDDAVYGAIGKKMDVIEAVLSSLTATKEPVAP